jgi:plastocyanin
MSVPRDSVLRRVLLGASAVALLATACGGDSGDGASAAGGNTVVISNFEFAPETLNVKVGDTITVENKDSAEHTVTALDKSFDTGRFGAGTKAFTVTKPGRFEYVCDVHPFMAHKFIQVSA